jgi:hypothetical protein
MDLKLIMFKGHNFIIVDCKDQIHFDKLVIRFKKQGFKQIK